MPTRALRSSARADSITGVKDIGSVRGPASLCDVAIAERSVNEVVDARGIHGDGERAWAEPQIRPHRIQVGQAESFTRAWRNDLPCDQPPCAFDVVHEQVDVRAAGYTGRSQALAVPGRVRRGRRQL